MDKYTPFQPRKLDGYLNATKICQSQGSTFAEYFKLKSTKSFVNELSKVTNIPQDTLIMERGTWVHPRIAVHIEQRLCPDFAIAKFDGPSLWDLGGKEGKIPLHIRKYIISIMGIPYEKFSIMNEVSYTVLAQLESVGYKIPENVLPDIARGTMFYSFLLERNLLVNLPLYTHTFANGSTIRSQLHPIKHLFQFRNYLKMTWIPLHMVIYFEETDKSALPFIKRAFPKVHNPTCNHHILLFLQCSHMIHIRILQ